MRSRTKLAARGSAADREPRAASPAGRRDARGRRRVPGGVRRPRRARRCRTCRRAPPPAPAWTPPTAAGGGRAGAGELRRGEHVADPQAGEPPGLGEAAQHHQPGQVPAARRATPARPARVSMNASSTTSVRPGRASAATPAAGCSTEVGLVGLPTHDEVGVAGHRAPGRARKPSAVRSSTRSTACPAARSAASGSVNCGCTTTACARRAAPGRAARTPRAAPAVSSTSSPAAAVPGGDRRRAAVGVRVGGEVGQRVGERAAQPVGGVPARTLTARSTSPGPTSASPWWWRSYRVGSASRVRVTGGRARPAGAPSRPRAPTRRAPTSRPTARRPRPSRRPHPGDQLAREGVDAGGGLGAVADRAVAEQVEREVARDGEHAGAGRAAAVPHVLGCVSPVGGIERAGSRVRASSPAFLGVLARCLPEALPRDGRSLLAPGSLLAPAFPPAGAGRGLSWGPLPGDSGGTAPESHRLPPRPSTAQTTTQVTSASTARRGSSAWRYGH